MDQSSTTETIPMPQRQRSGTLGSAVSRSSENREITRTWKGGKIKKTRQNNGKGLSFHRRGVDTVTQLGEVTLSLGASFPAKLM